MSGGAHPDSLMPGRLPRSAPTPISSSWSAPLRGQSQRRILRRFANRRVVTHERHTQRRSISHPTVCVHYLRIPAHPDLSTTNRSSSALRSAKKYRIDLLGPLIRSQRVALPIPLPGVYLLLAHSRSLDLRAARAHSKNKNTIGNLVTHAGCPDGCRGFVNYTTPKTAT